LIEVALGHANKQKPKQGLSPLCFWHCGDGEEYDDAKPKQMSYFNVTDFQKLSNSEKDKAVLEKIDISNEPISHNDFKLCLENRLRNSLKAMIKKWPKEFDDFATLQSDALLCSVDDYTLHDISTVYKVHCASKIWKD
jgi:hypothetical protein